MSYFSASDDEQTVERTLTTGYMKASNPKACARSDQSKLTLSTSAHTRTHFIIHYYFIALHYLHLHLRIHHLFVIALLFIIFIFLVLVAESWLRRRSCGTRVCVVVWRRTRGKGG